jgi:glycosyltransferase involved in cell wall biosynthesis
MRNNPLVSVIIPAFNAERHIAACIKSVLDQTWKSLEIIVVDDGSSDRTLEIARSFKKDGIIVLSQENAGGCTARNRGYEASQGGYIQFLDADDLISRDKIESQVKRLLNEPGKVAVCQTIHFFDGEDPYTQPVPDESGYLYDTKDTVAFFSHLWGADGVMHMVQTSAWLIEREMIEQNGKWHEVILLDQDGEFFTRIVLASNGICFTEGMNYYRKYSHGRNVAGKYKKYRHLSSAIDAAELKSSYLLRTRTDARSRKAAANLFMQLAIDAYPVYPALYKRCMVKLGHLQARPVIPVLGGKAIESIKFLFGWKVAKRISYEFHKWQAI